MKILKESINQKLIPFVGEKRGTILYHISNFRTPLEPTMRDWRNLYDLPSEEEKERCWHCGLKTKELTCSRCGYDKFFMTNK